MKIATLLFWDGVSYKEDGSKLYGKLDPKVGVVYDISVIPAENGLFESKGSRYIESEAQIDDLRQELLELRKSNFLVYVKPE